jgi:hypothetical protein
MLTRRQNVQQVEITSVPVKLMSFLELECNLAGQCSDAEALVDWDRNRYGSCVLPKQSWASLSPIPVCTANSGLLSFPNGCVNPALNQSACSLAGSWWNPATTQEECLQPRGCFDTYLPTLQSQFSPKDEGNCTSEYNFGTYESYFTWSPATWYHGVSRPAVWKQRKVVTKNTWNTTLDFPKLEEAYFASGTNTYIFQLKVGDFCARSW